MNQNSIPSIQQIMYEMVQGELAASAHRSIAIYMTGTVAGNTLKGSGLGTTLVADGIPVIQYISNLQKVLEQLTKKYTTTQNLGHFILFDNSNPATVYFQQALCSGKSNTNIKLTFINNPEGGQQSSYGNDQLNNCLVAGVVTNPVSPLGALTLVQLQPTTLINTIGSATQQYNFVTGTAGS
jgi:type VI protein secretion system component Hcp